MTAETRRLFTVDEYQAMERAGIITDDDKVELLDGEIVCKPPMNPPHIGTTAYLTHVLVTSLSGRAIVTVQSDVALRPRSQPQPDLSVLRMRDDFYRTRHPEPDDILLVIEVADTSLRDDRRVKAPLYAGAGIRELWIVDVNARRIEVHRDPQGDAYASGTIAGRGETVSPLAFPDLALSVDEVLP